MQHLVPVPADARHAPATLRNREPLVAVLREELPGRGVVLEIASGTGEHAVHFAAALPALTWQPSDRDDEALRSIAAHRAAAALANLRPPVALDASAAEWPLAAADAILSVNLIHIAPWAATEGLMHGAGRLLPDGAPLVLYGPFIERDVVTAPSNLAFDDDLRSRDPAWGIRRLEEVAGLAARRGLALARRIAMPANNLVVVFRRGAAQAGRVRLP